jgi:hypothetical protein
MHVLSIPKEFNFIGITPHCMDKNSINMMGNQELR